MAFAAVQSSMHCYTFFSLPYVNLLFDPPGQSCIFETLPFLLTLKALFPVMFVNAGMKTSARSKLSELLLFLLWSDHPLAVKCLASVLQFTCAEPRPGPKNSTRT